MNELTIIPQNDGFLASSDEKSVFFPNAELAVAGCRNCIWKLHSQCPYGLKDDEVIVFDEINVNGKESNKIFKIYKEAQLPKQMPNQTYGICPEMILFLSSLAGKGNELTEVWEKFHVYKARLQESVDYADFVNLTKEVKLLEKEINSSIPSNSDLDKLDKLKMDRNAAKLWWARLNQHVITSMQKINDRESKQSDTPKLAGIHSSGTINFNIKNEIKQIEEK